MNLNTTTAPVNTLPARTAPAVRFVGKKDIEHAIEIIKHKGEQFDMAVQEVQLSTLNHAMLHGDITLWVGLFNALPKGSRKNALAEHAVKYGVIVINMDEDLKKRKAKPFLCDMSKATDLVAAQAEPWYEMSPEKPVDLAFDFQKQLLALLKKADKAANDPTKTFSGRDLLESARKLVGQA
jgi:hypothetical protein